ncbi:MAG: ATP synthase protein I [Sphingobacteriales bacterium]|jgi:ATP synthase protein I
MRKNPFRLQEQNKKDYQSYMKYAGMGFTMIVIILAGSFFGQWLDGKFAFDQPWMTIVFSLLGVGASLYHFISQVNR